MDQTLNHDPSPGDVNTDVARSKSQRSLLHEILETAIIAVLIFVLVRSVVLNFQVDGDSMLPSMESGQMVLVSRVSYGELNLGDLVDWIPGVPDQHWLTLLDYGAPERGDVIVFTPPEPGKQKPYIKRVIGVPGDRVQITRDQQLMVNGIVIDEPYTGTYPTGCGFSHPYCDVTVPEGYVFAMGDHRNRSEDSRFFGVVPVDQIIGKAWMVYWPIGDFGLVEHPRYPELEP